MTSEEIDRLTISELREAADRVAAALAVLREAGAWGQGPATVTSAAARPAAQPPSAPAVQFRPDELAQRSRLLAQMRPDLPPEIAALEDA